MKNKSFLIVVSITITLFIISVVLREIQFSDAKIILNMDASYHTLLTVKAYDETSWTIHKFLPIISLGKELDKYIPWGATIPDSKGNYYYTSFGTLGFLLPYIAFKLFALEPSIHILLRFNFVIHFLSTTAFSLLVWRTLEPIATSQARKIVATITAASVYIFSLESLYSHGIVYWHHSPWNLIWISQILCFQTLAVTDKPSLKLKRFYFFLCFISPLLEWTGFLGNIILATLPFLLVELRKKQLYPKIVLAITASCIGAYLFHFTVVVGFNEALTALQFRFEARNVVRSFEEIFVLIKELFNGYLQSFGLIVWVSVISLFLLRKKLFSPSWLLFKIALLASSFVMLENFLMLQHAVAYTFDRLKVIIPVTLLAVALLSTLPKRWAGITLSVIALSVTLNINTYTLDNIRETDVQSVVYDNKKFVQSLTPRIHPCTILAVNTEVRGWMNLSFNRGIYEYILDNKVLQELVERRKACNGILIKAETPMRQPIIQHFKGAELYDSKNHKISSIIFHQ